MSSKGLLLLRWLKQTMHDLQVSEDTLEEAMHMSDKGSWPMRELVAQVTAQDLSRNTRALQRAIDDVLGVVVVLDSIER
jgi:hypothetical protein